MSRRLEELQLRAHDLPPAWDGVPVTWSDWGPREGVRGQVFICPPPKVPDHCGRCGSIENPIRNRGLVDVDERQVLRLLVNRCPDCHFDQVWDLDDDQWWDLGPEDYGDGGSVPPAASSAVENRQQVRSEAAKARARAAVTEARAKQESLW